MKHKYFQLFYKYAVLCWHANIHFSFLIQILEKKSSPYEHSWDTYQQGSKLLHIQRNKITQNSILSL